MTKITFFKINNLFYGFEATGHSGFGELGKDIVCSAISTALQMSIVEFNVLGFKFSTKKNDKKGYLYCKLLNSEDFKTAQSIFSSLNIVLKDLEKQFTRYLKLEVKDEVN